MILKNYKEINVHDLEFDCFDLVECFEQFDVYESAEFINNVFGKRPIFSCGDKQKIKQLAKLLDYETIKVFKKMIKHFEK